MQDLLKAFTRSKPSEDQPSPTPTPTAPDAQPSIPKSSDTMARLARATMGRSLGQQSRSRNTSLASLLPDDDAARRSASGAGSSGGSGESEQGLYHFHVYSHKHNTHVTVTKPNRDAIISLSCGNLGFRHAHRKTYDAAYQLGAYVVDKLYQNGWHHKIHAMEVVLRGFGQGREAVTKVLLGDEGKLLRPKIVQVADATRLKFGGTRSKNIRRLG